MYLPTSIKQYIPCNAYKTENIGKSGAGVYYFDNMVLKVQPISAESENEQAMMRWLHGKICVPHIYEQINENGYSYLLMSKCDGHMSCAEMYMTRPAKQAELLAGILHKLWSIPTEGCPCEWPLETRLRQAANNVESGNVDIMDAQPDTFGSNGFKDPEQLLHWLIDNKPNEAHVVSHGDFCLPNVFVNDQGLTGLIDLGRAGTADPWQDIALCLRSLSNNYSGVYDGRKYPGFSDALLFDALGMKPDHERIRYYVLLDELF